MGAADRFSANTFLMGAQKSGTTWLAALLEQSADVCVSDPKEPQFFTNNFDRGETFYRDCFARPEAPVLLDASTSYTFLRPAAQLDVAGAPGIAEPIPQRIAAWCPQARFIYIMRDPVKRAASAYRHNIRLQAPPKGPVSLVSCLQDRPMLRLISSYADQIERYLAIFPRERFLFVDFRDLTRDPLAVVARVCAHLGISADGIVLEEAEGGKHTGHRLTGAGLAVHHLRQRFPGLARGLRAALPGKVETVLAQRVAKAPADIRFHDEEAAAALFEADRARVFELTGLKI